jgi:hypothetical protein
MINVKIKNLLIKIILIIYISIYSLSCVQSDQSLNDSGYDIMNFLLFDKNMYQMDNNAKWQVSGVLLKSDTSPLAEATVAIASKTPLRVAIDNSTKTDTTGRFTMNLKSGAITLKVTDANGLAAGTLELSISNQGTIIGRPGDGSSFSVSTINSTYVYPSGATTALSISSIMYKSIYEYEYNKILYNYVYPGATVYLDLEILNNSEKAISGITGSITSNSPYVTISNPICSYTSYLIKNLSPGYFQSINRDCMGYSSNNYTTISNMTNVGNASSYFVINVSSEIPSGTNLDFTLTLRDSNNKTYSIPFNIATSNDSPSLTLSNWNYLSNGSNSSQILPGDKVYLNPLFYNSGNIPLKDLNVTVSSTSPYVSIGNNLSCYYSQNVGSLRPGYYQSYYYRCNGYYSWSYQPSSNMSTYNYSDYISLDVLNSAPAGASIPITFTVTDSYQKTYTFNIQLSVANYSKSVSLSTNNSSLSNGNTASRFYPGDTLYLNPIFNNNGNIRLRSLKAFIETSSPYLTVSAPSCSSELGNIETNYYQNFYNKCYNYYPSGSYSQPSSSIYTSYPGAYFRATISSSAPSGEVIPVQYRLVDASGQEYVFNFSISINTFTSSQSMNLISNTMLLTNGNSVSSLYPGDSIYLNPIFQSSGYLRLNSLNATLSSTSNLVSIVNPTCSANMGNLNPGFYQNYYNRCYTGNTTGISSSPSSSINSSFNSYYFKVTLASNVPSGTVIPMTYTITDSGGSIFRFNFNLTIANYTSNQQSISFSGNTISPLSGNWYITSSNCQSGNCMQSNAIGHNGSTSVTYSGGGYSRISFYWRVSSESGYDYCKFYIDGVLQDSISGTSMSSPVMVSKTTSVGNHTLKWEYSKDGSVVVGSDACYVDTINLL